MQPQTLGRVQAAGGGLSTQLGFVETGSSSRDKFSLTGGQFVYVSGDVVGIYPFRRDELRRTDRRRCDLPPDLVFQDRRTRG
jgi:hypothetical protein